MNAAEFRVRLATFRSRIPKRLGLPAFPLATARAYERKLVKWINTIRGVALLELQSAVTRARPLTSVIADAKDPVGDAVDKLKAEAVASAKRSGSRFAQTAGQGVADVNKASLNARLSPIVGVSPLESEPWLAGAVAEFTRENVALIKSLPTETYAQIEKLIQAGMADGVRWEVMAEQINERFDVGESRARLIARDQCGKFNGDLERVRNVNLGITSYIWRTVNDERVRDEHAERNGKKYSWGELDEEPGEAVLCRCTAEPDLMGVFADDE